jgi:hypothetical protein
MVFFVGVIVTLILASTNEVLVVDLPVLSVALINCTIFPALSACHADPFQNSVELVSCKYEYWPSVGLGIAVPLAVEVANGKTPTKSTRLAKDNEAAG